MARPRKSTRDEWIDQFVSWPLRDQQIALAVCEALHRRAWQTEPVNETSDQPAASPGTETE